MEVSYGGELWMEVRHGEHWLHLGWRETRRTGTELMAFYEGKLRVEERL